MCSRKQIISRLSIAFLLLAVGILLGIWLASRKEIRPETVSTSTEPAIVSGNMPNIAPTAVTEDPSSTPLPFRAVSYFLPPANVEGRDTLLTDDAAAAMIIPQSTRDFFGLADTEVTLIRSNLTRRLYQPHQSVNRDSVNAMNVSLAKLSEKIPPDKANNKLAEVARINLLVDIGWANDGDAIYNTDVVRGYEAFDARIADAVKKVILDGTPAESKKSVEPELTNAIESIKLRLDNQAGLMHVDMLCPAYKWELDPARANYLISTIKAWAFIPTFGENVAEMQLPQEAFSTQLKMFVAMLPRVVAFKLANERISWELAKSADWRGVQYQMQTAPLEWGFTLHLEPQRSRPVATSNTHGD